MNDNLDEMLKEAPTLTFEPFPDKKEDVVTVETVKGKSSGGTFITGRTENGGRFCVKDRSDKYTDGVAVWSRQPEENSRFFRDSSCKCTYQGYGRDWSDVN